MTDRVSEPRRVAAILAVEHDRAFDRGASPDEVRRELTEAARREAALATLGIMSVPSNVEPRAVALPPAPPGFDPSNDQVVERLLQQKRADGVGRAREVQIRAMVRLFVEAVGEGDIRAVTQGHLAKFREVMSRLPMSHGKSERQRRRPLADVLEAGVSTPAAQVGLSPSTVNRNLEIVRQTIKAAGAEGITVTAGINPSRIRRKDPKRQRGKWDALSLDDCRHIFRAPVWPGCKAAIRPRIPGPKSPEMGSTESR